ncbi:MAG: bifunctional riboflavin kinase/FAD synthetase [Dysgonamonadaceae bacterium]|jgi:riboflavin kinase/FMN adenylyltransferase|nr:bifunctional riboflavin kinase/FAD synthetase [Dysgonamonadaceae bacterium]
MDIIHIHESSLIEQETVATVGFFDGVHIGHRYLIRQMKDIARKAILKTAVITFPIHPRKVLQQEYQPQLLNSFDEKLKLLSNTGLDYCYIIDFTKEFSEISAQNFIREILHKQLHVKDLLIGYDHKFGKGRINEYKHYVAYGKVCGMNVHQAEKLSEENNPVSSTAIRNLLSKGKIKEAAKKLFYDYALEGNVIEGNKLGRTIGFPTANLELTDKNKIIPLEGVYAARVEIGDKQYSGMAYIGKRPTILSHGERRIEVHIFDFSEDIYGMKIRIEFIDFIRSDMRFGNVEDLRKQLEKDKKNITKRYQKNIFSE